MHSSPFRSFIESQKGTKLYIEPLAGNNGDTLILMGLKHLLNKTDSLLTDTPDEADTIVLNGGGAMNDLWPSGAAQVLDSYIKKFPSKRYIVAPSSYYFTHLDFVSILSRCQSKITLFCRELISRDHLKKLFPSTLRDVEIQVSQDLALELADSEFIEQLVEKRSSSHVLCAMRKDREGNAGILAKTSASWLPRAIRKPLSKLRDRLVAKNSTDTLSPILSEISPSPKSSEVVYRDVSVSVPFEEFCTSIQSASAVITNRLHVAILSSLLGKETHLIQGSYHKAKGVYEYSLESYPNTKLH